MSRGIGELELLGDLLPEWLAIVFALLTQLGDVWFLATLLGVLYWFEVGDRTDVATVAGTWLTAIGLYRGLKEVFALPRPPHPLAEPGSFSQYVGVLYEATGTATGYGFPSGHAVGSTVAYFGLASVLPISTPRRRFAGAAVIVTTICFTRVGLGVHYVVDVVAGVGVGLLVLAAAYALTARSKVEGPTITFSLAIALGGFYLLTSAFDLEAIALLAASLGAFVGWQWTNSGVAAPLLRGRGGD